MPTRRQVISALGGIGVSTLRSGVSRCATRRSGLPNILFIFSDQQHGDALGLVDPFFDTPALDALARESAYFPCAFCTTPQCSPSRSSIMTGLYPTRTGVYGNIGMAGGNPLNRRTIGAHLHDHGYTTAYFGKWHLGKNISATEGWDEDFGVTGREERNDSEVTERAIRYLGQQAQGDKPFALFLSYLDPHDIYGFKRHSMESDPADISLPSSWRDETFSGKPSVQKQFMTEDQGTAIWDEPRDEWLRYRDCYRSKVRLFDSHAGRVMDAMKRFGLWESTIFVVTSDHGDMDTHHRLIFKGPFMYEQMMKVPLMIRVPSSCGGKTPSVIDEMDVVNVDLYPTLLDLCGIPHSGTDGLSLAPILTGRPGQVQRDFVVGEYYSKQRWVNPIRMVRTRSFKYTRYRKFGEELYDLVNDPHEIINLFSDRGYGSVLGEMRVMLDEWIMCQNDPFKTLIPTSRNGYPLGE